MLYIKKLAITYLLDKIFDISTALRQKNINIIAQLIKKLAIKLFGYLFLISQNLGSFLKRTGFSIVWKRLKMSHLRRIWKGPRKPQ